MRILWTAVLAGTVIATATGVGVAKMQFQKAPTSTQTTPRTSVPSALPPIDGQPADQPDPMGAMREARRVRAMASERQKKIVDDTSRLVQLATELNSDPDKAAKDEAARKLDEIEKLARDVKQRMKG